MTDRLVAICGSGPLAFMARGALPIMEGCTKLLEGPVRSAVAFAINLANDNPIAADALPVDLLQVLCLFVGILGIASLMGIGVSVLESVRPELAEKASAREKRVLDALAKPVTAGEETLAEEAPAQEAVPEDAPTEAAAVDEEAPAEEALTEEAPGEEAPAEESPLDDRAGEDAEERSLAADDAL
jgi:hypothetical protein